MKKVFLLAFALTFVSATTFAQVVDTGVYSYDCKLAESLLGTYGPHSCLGRGNNIQVTSKDLTVPIACSETRIIDCDSQGYELISYRNSHEVIKNTANIIALDKELNTRYKKVSQLLSNGTSFYPVSLSYFTLDQQKGEWIQNSGIGPVYINISLSDLKKRLGSTKQNLDNVKRVLVSGQRSWVNSKDTCLALSGRSLPQSPRELAGNKTGLYESANTPFYQCFIDEYTQRIKILKELEQRLNPEIGG
jgi:uncharacterized protein YecT (DUF1311 family)